MNWEGEVLGVTGRGQLRGAADGLAPPRRDHGGKALVPPQAIQQATAARRQERGRVLPTHSPSLRPLEHLGESQSAHPLHQVNADPVRLVLGRFMGRAGQLGAGPPQVEPINFLEEEFGRP